jgi:hypothetical protein
MNEFRATHRAALGDLFQQVLEECMSAGLVKLGHVAIDGTKLKANASKHKAMSDARMEQDEQRLSAEIRSTSITPKPSMPRRTSATASVSSSTICRPSCAAERSVGAARSLVAASEAGLGAGWSSAPGQRKELDRPLVHVELLEVEHGTPLRPLPREVARSFTASITPTVSFPFTSAATITVSITSTPTITATFTSQVLIVRS